MGKDVTAFRERFNAYKNGKSVSEIYDAGLPKYAEGTEGWLPDYTMDYILALENPTKQGLVDGIWRPPTDSSKWDINAIGGGLDIRYKNNPLVYNFLSDNNRLNNPYLTEQEEYDLRKRTFDDTMLPALIRMHDKYGEQISSKGYARLAAMKWQGHPFLMAITPDSITGRAFLNAIESGDRDLDTVFNAYYRHPANAKKYAARIQSDENYWSNNHSINLGDVPVQSTLHPIIEKPDAVVVRKTIPKAKTRARWTGAENVSPYLTGKPILKLKKEIKTPNVVELHKESQWKAPMQFKDGKLPRYGDGEVGSTVNALLHPISEIRQRLYNNVFPYGYNNSAERAFSAIFKNKPHESELYGRPFYEGNEQRLDDLWATYLQIPDSQRHFPRVLTKSKYKPQFSKDNNSIYYSVPLNDYEKQNIINHGLRYGNYKNAPKLLNPDFGNYTVSRGRDTKGDYVSYWDVWDLNPLRGITNIGNSITDKLGLGKIEDLSFGIGKPLELYDRIYLDDYYGVKGADRGGTYIPEITVNGRNKKIVLEEDEPQGSGKYNHGEVPKYSNGKSTIHIKPANRGKFTALKKRTGHSASWFKENGTPAQKKMAVFALNAKKWKH